VKKLAFFLAIGVVMSFAFACGDDDDDDDEAGAAEEDGDGEAAAEGEDTPLIIARGFDINSLDPNRAYCDTCQIYLSNVYQTLLRLDPADNETLIAGLAEEWEVNDESTVYTFHLNPDATFSDGTPVEASDVKWTWERLGNLQESPSYFVANVESIEAPDAQTVIVNMASADSSFFAVTTAPYMSIINQEVAEANGAVAGEDAAEADGATEFFDGTSAGSGPYILESYTPDNELRLTVNENFWGDRPFFHNVVLKHTVEAVAQRQLLETGEADIAMQVTPDLAADIGEEVVAEEVPSFNFVYVGIIPGSSPDVDLNEDVRHAIRAAINYEAIIEATLAGAGRKQAAPIPNGFLGTEGLELPERDLDRARELLASAGLADGFELDAIFPTFNVYGVDFTTMFEQLKIDLEEVGITLNLEPAEPSVWIEQATNGEVPFTAIYFAPDHTDSSQYVQYFGMVEGAFWQGLIGVLNEEQATLLAEALATTDTGEKADLYQQIAELMIEESYIIAIVNPNLILAYREGILGMHYSACCNLEIFRLSRD
jgi:peptide/nickel transport system substrate-binding protein